MFLKVLSGEIAPNSGQVSTHPGQRLSFLKQDHHAYDQESVLDCITLGNPKLYAIGQQRSKIYEKEPFSEEDGILASKLEAEFAELGGWEAEAEAGTLLSGLGLSADILHKSMAELNGAQKVKVLLAQALFGAPDVLLLDEPTNDLDIEAIHWLENFLLEFKNTLIVVSHDRHFLNRVCTHMADIDYSRITIYSGNYSFWLQASELNLKLRSDQKKKAEDKAKELKTFIARFSANAAKSKQATSRRKILESLDLSSLPVSSRKYPYIHFEQQREAGKDILTIHDLSYESHGKTLLHKVNVTIEKGDKVVILGDDATQTALLSILGNSQLSQHDSALRFGVTISRSYFPKDHHSYFENDQDKSLLEWLGTFTTEKQQDETFLRSFLGRMLFSKDDVHKKVKVLSGGEKVRCILAKMMLQKANLLILDNPTAHLDLESITALNNGISAFKGTVIFSSTDHEFIQTIANRILVFDRTGHLTMDQKTDYSSYLDYTS